MALKLKKMPKKPKGYAKASLETKQRSLTRLLEAKKYNQRVIALRKMSVNMDKKIEKAIAGFGKCK